MFTNFSLYYDPIDPILHHKNGLTVVSTMTLIFLHWLVFIYPLKIVLNICNSAHLIFNSRCKHLISFWRALKNFWPRSPENLESMSYISSRFRAWIISLMHYVRRSWFQMLIQCIITRNWTNFKLNSGLDFLTLVRT